MEYVVDKKLDLITKKMDNFRQEAKAGARFESASFYFIYYSGHGISRMGETFG